MKSFKFIHLFIAFINVIFALLFIVSSFSDAVAPYYSVIFSYLGLLFPVFFFINCFFLVFWLIMRKWFNLLLIIITFAICCGPISRYAPFHFKDKYVPTDNVFKILSYNVMGFGYKNHSVDNPNEILKYIVDSDADIVCLQEYLVGNSDDFMTHEKVLDVLHMYKYYYNLPLVSYKKYTIGLAIFSKFPIIKSWRVPYKSSFNGSSVHEIDVHGKRLTIINNHLESFKLTMEDRSKYSNFIKNMNVENFDGLRETVQRKLGSAFLIRAGQAEAVANTISGIDSEYTVVCGDFNDTPISYAHHVIQGDSLKDAFVESGEGIGITYNQNYFWFRIDHILHSLNLKSYKTTIDKVYLSDHYPMWTYLEMN